MKTNIRKMTAKMMVMVMIIVAIFAAVGTTANAAEAIIGTTEKVAEYKAEALAEKALATKGTETVVEAEPVVEGATGAEEVTVAEAPVVVTEEAKAEAAPVETVKEETPVATEVIETEEVEEVIFAEGTTSEEEFDGEDINAIANVASTATTAPATDSAVVILDAATTAQSADNVKVDIADAKSNYQEVSVQAAYLGVKGGNKKAFTVIGKDTLFKDAGQSLIDAGNIVCYPSCDMTKGVKWFAGHNPGAMKHMSNIGVGSIVRLSNASGEYQDYKIVDRTVMKAGSSMASISFKGSKSGSNLWAMLQNGTENAVVVQFCINGTPNLFYGQAI